MSNDFDPPTEEQRPLLKADVIDDRFDAPHENQLLHPDVVDEGYSPYETRTDTSAVIALVFAMLSFVLLPVIGALIALALAPRAKSRIRHSEGRIGGATLARIAQGLAVLNIFLVVVLAYFVVQLVQWLISYL